MPLMPFAAISLRRRRPLPRRAARRRFIFTLHVSHDIAAADIDAIYAAFDFLHILILRHTLLFFDATRFLLHYFSLITLTPPRH